MSGSLDIVLSLLVGAGLGVVCVLAIDDDSFINVTKRNRAEYIRQCRVENVAPTEVLACYQIKKVESR